MTTTDLSQQHVLPDPAHALPTNTLVDETQRLASSGQSGVGGGPAEVDLRESARRQVEQAKLAASSAPAPTSSASATTDLQQQHAIPDKSTALPTNTLVDETQRLADAGKSGLGGSSVQTVGNTSASFTPKVPVPKAEGQTSSTSSSAPTTDIRQQHVIADKATALPTNTLVDETVALAEAGKSGLGGSSTQTVGNTTKSFTPHTASDHNKTAHDVVAKDAGPAVQLEGYKGAGTSGAGLLSDQVPPAVYEALDQAKAVVGEKVEVAKSGLEHAFNKDDTITPGNELPGGWGPAAPVTTAGGAHSTTTIYQDISSALNTVGQAAYNAVPESLKERLHSPNATPIKTTTNTVPHQVGQAQQQQLSHTTDDVANVLKDGAQHVQESVKAAADRAQELAQQAYNSLPAVADILPSRETTDAAKANVNQAAQAAQNNAQAAADNVKANLGQAADSASQTVKAAQDNAKVATDKAVDAGRNAYNAAPPADSVMPDPAQIIPHSRDATSGSSLATTELPTLADIKGEVVHAVDSVKGLFGFKGANVPAPATSAQPSSTSSSHEVKAVDAGPKVDLDQSGANTKAHDVAPVDKGPKVELLSSAREVAPAEPAPSAVGPSTSSTASATRGEVTPSQVGNSSLTGSGGLAAGIASSVAEAARHSSATSVGEKAPGFREDPRAGGGGLAAYHAEEIADAARHSHATSIGAESSSGNAATADLAHEAAQEAARFAEQHRATGIVHDANIASPTVTGEQSALAGGGGLAATIAPEVARAAQESTATSVGATGPNTIPVAPEHGHGHTESRSSVPATTDSLANLHLGRPVEVAGGASLAAAGLTGAAAASSSVDRSSSKVNELAVPEPRETSHAPSAIDESSVPTSSAAPTTLLSSSSPDKSSKTGASATDAPSSTVKDIESEGRHGLVKTASGYKHRHELTPEELEAHDRAHDRESSSSASAAAAADKGIEKGSSVPPHDDINAGALKPTTSTSSDSPSGHKKKLSLGEKLKEKLHLGDK